MCVDRVKEYYDHISELHKDEAYRASWMDMWYSGPGDSRLFVNLKPKTDYYVVVACVKPDTFTAVGEAQVERFTTTDIKATKVPITLDFLLADTEDGFTYYVRPDGLTDCDFAQPPEEERIDNIAGAIAACGLLELEKISGDPARRAAAEKLVDGLLDHCCNWSPEAPGILTKCTASYHDDGAGRHTNIVYGDYFLVEALAKLAGTDPMLWL